MPQFLSTDSPDFEATFTRLLSAKREDSPDVDTVVTGIIDDVRARGDAAVLELTERFDRIALTPDTMVFSEAEIDAACAEVGAEDRAALELAAERIRAYHARQMPSDAYWTDDSGAELGWRWSAVSAAGLYVPGGLATYPSSVLMNAIPAKVAGVERLVITVPTPDGVVNPLVLLAARLGGVDQVFRIGGAQAVAALAYGTDTIAPVDKITGPGNAFVAAAKRRVFGKVGIDMIAGPSEILVIADGTADPDWVAIDMLSQAEHDASAQALLITPDADFARAATASVETHLATLERREIAGASWRDFGAVIVVRDLAEAAALTDRIAPEHLELCVGGARGLVEPNSACGCDFSGQLDPGGHWRLRRGAEPRIAHGQVRAVFEWSVGDGFPQAHDADQDDTWCPRCHRTCRRAPGCVRELGGPRAECAGQVGSVEPDLTAVPRQGDARQPCSGRRGSLQPTALRRTQIRLF